MPLTLAAIACLLAITLCYIAVCAGSPFGTCRKCRGFGHKVTVNRKGQAKRGKQCRRCRGYGKRIRVGRWIFNRTQRIYREGTR
ncbi:hypothetical protein [Streptomyces sp. NPDC003032]